jgi:NADP-dependent 3-hydroxy acid dehydrogenase YdfG
MFDLTGKTALVTGAGRGVGVGIARALLDAGATVLVNDLIEARANDAVSFLGSRARSLVFDVADAEAVDAAIAGAGPIDILVNNAGIPPSMRAEKFRTLPRSEWAPYVDVNRYGVLNCVKATIDGMCERGWGRVITISSSPVKPSRSTAAQQPRSFDLEPLGNTLVPRTSTATVRRVRVRAVVATSRRPGRRSWRRDRARNATPLAVHVRVGAAAGCWHLVRNARLCR